MVGLLHQARAEFHDSAGFEYQALSPTLTVGEAKMMRCSVEPTAICFNLKYTSGHRFGEVQVVLKKRLYNPTYEVERKSLRPFPDSYV